MFEDEVKATWKRGQGVATLSRADIERMLQPVARRTGRALEVIAWSYVAILGLTVLMAIGAFVNFAGDSTLRTVEVTLALAAAGAGGLTVRLVRHLRGIDRTDRPLLEIVERRLAFAERTYAGWLVVASTAPWALSVAVTTFLGSLRGGYRIEHPGEFTVVTAVMIGVTYLALRFSTAATVYELRAAAHDLRAEVLEATPQVAPRQRRARTTMTVAVGVLAAAVLVTLLLWAGVL